MILVEEEKGVFSTNYDKAQKYAQQKFGLREGKNLILTLYEVLFLLEKEKIQVMKNSKELSILELKKKKEFNIQEYKVYKDLRTKGYVPKTGLKYGCEFRLYEKGKEHAPWLVKIINEKEKIKAQELSAFNRVAHSTKKKVLLVFVDSEDSLLYIEQSWKKL
jgi:tRNA-intron endonuclease